MDNSDVNQYASSVGAKVVGTSAKNGKGVQELFLELTKTLLKQQAATKNKNGSRMARGPKSGLVIVDDEKDGKKEDGGCCNIL